MISTAVHTTSTPKDWQELRIKDVSFVNSKSLGNDTNPYYQFKYVDIGNVNQNGIVNEPETIQFHEAPSRARRIVIKGDVIVSTVRTYLKAVAYFDFNPKDYIVSTGFAVLSHTKKINPAYLSYFCQSDYFIDSVIENSKGVSYPAINATELSCLSVYYPPFEEQTAIAKYLDTKTQAIDKKVSLLEKKIDYYQELRKSLINETVTKGLDRNVKLKESDLEFREHYGISHIPEHWNTHRLDWITSIVRGNTGFGKDELLSNGEYVALQYGKTYQVDEVNNTFQYFVNSEFYKQTQVVNRGDTILISTSETIEDLGHSCFYNRDELGLIGGEQILLKPNHKYIFGKYLYYCSKKFGSELRRNATGLKVYRFNTDDLKQIFIALPPLEEQIQIANYLTDNVSKIDQIIANIQTQITTLKELRKTLINDVVTGKIKVSESGLAGFEDKQDKVLPKSMYNPANSKIK